MIKLKVGHIIEDECGCMFKLIEVSCSVRLKFIKKCEGFASHGNWSNGFDTNMLLDDLEGGYSKLGIIDNLKEIMK